MTSGQSGNRAGEASTKTSRFLAATVHRDQADSAAEYKWIAEIALVKEDSAVDGRNADAVAIVADAGHHALHHLDRMQHSGRQALG